MAKKRKAPGDDAAGADRDADAVPRAQRLPEPVLPEAMAHLTVDINSKLPESRSAWRRSRTRRRVAWTESIRSPIFVQEHR